MTTIALRLDLQLWIRFTAGVHVGGLDAGSDVDLPVLVDTSGRPLIPGTSWVGTLRSWSEGRAEHHDSTLRDWWGYITPGKSDDGRASRITISDSVILAGPDQITDFLNSPATALTPPLDVAPVDGVGIDRTTGAAADGILYSRELVPAGSVCPVDIRLEARRNEVDDAWRLAHDLVEAFRSEGITVGAAATRGLGRIELLASSSRFRHLDLTDRAALLATLDQSWRPLDNLPKPEGERRFGPTARTAVTVDWVPRSPIMVKASIAGEIVDTLPRTATASDGGLRAVIPGSSIKGGLRSTAERILATVLDLDAGQPLAPTALTEEHKGFIDQLNHPCFDLARLLFGIEGKRDGGTGNDGAERTDDYGRAAVTVHDCLSHELLDRDQWLRLVTPTSGTGVKPPDGFAWADRVAIDRWLGGAAEGLLFSLLEPTRLTWAPLSFIVDHERMAVAGEDHGNAAWALLFLTLRELGAGRVPLGFGSTRGLGQITVRSTEFAGLPGTSGPCALTDVPTEVLATWSSAWHRYQEEMRG